MSDTDEQLHRLYELPLDEFTAARDQVSAELSEQGHGDVAAGVKKLRRPTVSAWAVNQLVRNSGSEVRELLSVGEEVRAAMSGGQAEAIRELTARRRRVVDRLLDRAEELLARGGHAASRSTLDKVGETLMAATMDEMAAEAVRGGRLERELSPPSGFEALAGQMPPPAARASKRDHQASERARRAESAARDAEKAAEDADRDARRLEEEAERARRDAERARRRADGAAERARELRQKAEQLSERR